MVYNYYNISKFHRLKSNSFIITVQHIKTILCCAVQQFLRQFHDIASSDSKGTSITDLYF